jgi:hypothetical protein
VFVVLELGLQHTLLALTDLELELYQRVDGRRPKLNKKLPPLTAANQIPQAPWSEILPLGAKFARYYRKSSCLAESVDGKRMSNWTCMLFPTLTKSVWENSTGLSYYRSR